MEMRIREGDSLLDILAKMGDGVPGALSVCGQIMQRAPLIDPRAGLGGLFVLLELDSLGIYGCRIWQLYKDACGQDLVKMIAVLRARQLGFVTRQEIYHAIANYGEGLDLDELLAQVQERLPDFGREEQEG